MTINITESITIGLIIPDLPEAKNWARADGSSATIPTKIIKDIPLPIPLAVICSPSHIKNIVPPTKVIMQDALKYHPGSDANPWLSRPTEMPYAWKKASTTVPYLVYWFIFFLPCSPSFLSCSNWGTIDAKSCIIIDEVI